MTDTKKAVQAIKDTVDNAKDSASEALHRSTADAEATRRDLNGDRMTTTEKITSVANETTHRVAAGIDHAKQAVRDRT